MDKICKSGQFRGLTLRRRDPTQQHKSTLRRGMSTPRRGREGGLDKPQVHRGEGLHRSVALVHRHVFLSCFAIRLFRGLFHWTNEDPISV